MRFLENLVADLIRDATGINARRLVRRIGGKRLLLGGLAAAGAAALASRHGAQGGGSGSPAGESTAAPASPGGGYAFTKGEAAGAGPVTPPPVPASAVVGWPAAGSPAPGSLATGSPSPGTPPAVPPPPPSVASIPPPAVPPPVASSPVASPAAAPPGVPRAEPGLSAAVPPPSPPAAEAAPAAPEAAPDATEPSGDLPVHLAYPAVRVMVAAALADGRLATEEKRAIQARLGDSGLDEAQVAQVHQDLVLPPTVEEIAELVADAADREVLYQLAAVVLQSDQRVTDLERVWLGRLGAAFGLAEERCRVLQEEAFGPGGSGPVPA